MPNSATSPTVVLVHGAWGDGSGWQKVIPLLLARGIAVRAVQNPTTSLADDVMATRRVLDTIEGAVVLAGHSWGGAVITEAGADDKVKALVYVAAFAPEPGQSVGDQVGAHPAPPALRKITKDANSFYWMSEAGWIEDVAHDLPRDTARLLSVLQAPLPESTFGDKVSVAAWKSRPSWYLVSSEDRAVSVDLQRHCASAMKAKTTELASSHMSPLSMPEAVAAAIIEAVEATAAGSSVAA